MNKKKYRCDICNKEVTSPQALTNHKQRHDKNEKPKYPCNICGKVYKYNKTLVAHTKTCHGGSDQNSKESNLTEIIETEIIETDDFDANTIIILQDEQINGINLNMCDVTLTSE